MDITTVKVKNGQVLGYETSSEFAKRVGVKPVTVRNWIRRKKIQALKIGNELFIPNATEKPIDVRTQKKAPKDDLQITRFRIKPGAHPDTSTMSPYAGFINPNATRSIHKHLVADIYVYIGFPEDISEWNDFDYVLVLDDMFGQPYYPFYRYLGGESFSMPPSLKEIIKNYNKVMGELPFLEEGYGGVC